MGDGPRFGAGRARFDSDRFPIRSRAVPDLAWGGPRYGPQPDIPFVDYPFDMLRRNRVPVNRIHSRAMMINPIWHVARRNCVSAPLVRGYQVLVFHSRSRAMICGTRVPAIHFRFRATFGRSLCFRAKICRLSAVIWRYCARERLECPNCARQHRACPEVARSVWMCGANGYTGTQHVPEGMCQQACAGRVLSPGQ